MHRRNLLPLSFLLAALSTHAQAPIERRPLPSAPAPQQRQIPQPPPPYYPQPFTWQHPDVDTVTPTLIGFSAGFGLGAGLAAANAAQGTKAQNAVVGGLLLSIVGAFIGHEIGVVHRRHYCYPRFTPPWPIYP